MEKSIEERYGCTNCNMASCEGCDSFLLVKGATEQKELDDKRIAELEKEKASLMLEIHNKNKRIAELIAR